MNRYLPALVTFAAGLLLGHVASGSAAGPDARPASGVDVQEPMVTGIGGVFFRAGNPDELRGWYRRHLGIDAGPQGATFIWQTPEGRPGRTVWSVFPDDTDYFGPSDQRFMVNYIVRDMDELLASLAEDGIEPVKEPEDYPYGRFAWIVDGEGNRIELWEPPSAAPGQ